MSDEPLGTAYTVGGEKKDILARDRKGSGGVGKGRMSRTVPCFKARFTPLHADDSVTLQVAAALVYEYFRISKSLAVDAIGISGN
jgi:hypothetical protein